MTGLGSHLGRRWSGIALLCLALVLGPATAERSRASEIPAPCKDLDTPIHPITERAGTPGLVFRWIDAQAARRPGGSDRDAPIELRVRISIRNTAPEDDPLGDRRIAWCGFVREGLYDPTPVPFPEPGGSQLLRIPSASARVVTLELGAPLAPRPQERIRALFHFVEGRGGAAWIATPPIDIVEPGASPPEPTRNTRTAEPDQDR